MKRKSKDLLKIIGIEIACMLVLIAVAALCSYMQIIGRTHIGSSKGSFFAGDVYRYNSFAYAGGMLLFGFVLWNVSKRFLFKALDSLKKYKVLTKVLVWGVSAACSFGMLVTLIIVNLMVLGLGDKMQYEAMSMVTIFGWPIFTALLQGGYLIIKVKA